MAAFLYIPTISIKYFRNDDENLAFLHFLCVSAQEEAETTRPHRHAGTGWVICKPRIWGGPRLEYKGRRLRCLRRQHDDERNSVGSNVDATP